MPMEADALADLKSMVAVARKRPLSFAICLGKKPEGAVFLMDRKKKPDILQRTAKKQGETPKLCSGEVSVKGKIISLQCSDAPPPGLIKHMKDFMSKTADLPMKFLLLDAEGGVLEAEEGDAEEFAALPAEGGEEDAGEEAAAAPQDAADAPEAEAAPAAAEPGAPAAAQAGAAEPNPAEEKLRAALAGMERQIAGLEDGAATAKLAPVAAHVGGQIEAGEFAKAAAGLKALGAALAKLGAEAAPAPAAPDPKWERMRAVLEPRVAEALKANHPEAGKIRAVWAFAQEKAEAGDTGPALKAGERLVGMLRPAAAPEAAPAADAPPEAAPAAAPEAAPASDAPPVNAKALAVARLKWIDTKRQMKADLDKFQAAVVSQADGDPDKAEIAAAATALIAEFDAFDEALQDQLDDVVNTPDGAKREGFKKLADGSIKTYQRVLESPFFRMIDDNPFTKVAVASNAKRSLELVSSALN